MDSSPGRKFHPPPTPPTISATKDPTGLAGRLWTGWSRRISFHQIPWNFMKATCLDLFVIPFRFPFEFLPNVLKLQAIFTSVDFFLTSFWFPFKCHEDPRHLTYFDSFWFPFHFISFWFPSGFHEASSNLTYFDVLWDSFWFPFDSLLISFPIPWNSTECVLFWFLFDFPLIPFWFPSKSREM